MKRLTRTYLSLIFVSVGMLICIGDNFTGFVKQKDRNSVYSQVRPSHSNDDKICVIHVGPGKTGSTSLQTFLISKRSQEKDALKQDSYELPIFPHQVFHHKNHAEFARCLRNEPGDFCQNEGLRINTFNYFQSFVNNATENGSNIVLTSEVFAKPDINTTQLASYLAPEYEIHIVLYYRRFYDWIYSLYNEVTKSKEARKRYNPHHRTFVEWLTQDMFDFNEPEYSMAVYNRYQKVPGVFNVSVVNMHEDPDNFDTTERFICDHMDQTPHLCELAKSQEVERSNPSKDVNLELFQLRVQQYHSIRLSDKDERLQQIERKFNNMTDIPQVCVSPEWKDKLLQISLESEIALTPEWWQNSEEGLNNLKSDFEEKIKSKLCSLDIETILTSPEWQNFLTELDEDKIEEGS